MLKTSLLAILCTAAPPPSAAWATPPALSDPRPVALTSSTSSLRGHGRRVARPCAGKWVKAPAPALGQAYSWAGSATIAVWAIYALAAWSRSGVTQPVLKWLTAAQPLTVLPLAFAVFTSLASSATKEGWWAMNRMTYRRLNLGAAAMSAWLAGLAVMRGGGALAVGVHVATALLCIFVWVRATSSPGVNLLTRFARGTVGSAWALVPQTAETSSLSKSGSASHLDDPECAAGRDGRNEYSIATVGFLWFAVMPAFVDMPLAVVPEVLGLGSAAAAWSLLAAVAAYVLKDATQRGRIHSGTTFRYLRYGFIAASGSHLLLVALELFVTGSGLRYLRTDAVSLLMHALVVLAALTPPPKVPKKKSEPTVVPPAEPEKAAAPVATAPEAAAPEVAAVPVVAEKPKKVVPAVPAAAFGVAMGQKVLWAGKKGTVRFVGSTKFASGEWVGVELESQAGMHDGTVLGVSYFSCAPGRGIFTQAAQLTPA